MRAKHNQTAKNRKNEKYNSRTNVNKVNSLKQVPIFSANGAGCISKIQSIVDNINNIKAGIVTLQETHFKKK